MKKHFCLLLLVFLSLIVWAEENFLFFDINISLLVFDADKVQEDIISWIEKEKGHFIYRSDNQLNLRVPWEASMKLRGFLNAMDLDVLEFNQNAMDLREEILQLKSGIKSREEILAKNLALIDRADTKGTLAIEQEVVRLIREIEYRKGRLTKLEYDRLMASVQISFNFKQSSRPENIDSAFEWLNQVDMYELLKGGF